MKRNLSTIIFLFYLAMTFDAKAYIFTDDFEKGFYWKNFPIGMNKFVSKVSDGVVLNTLVQSCQEEWEAEIGMPIWSIPANLSIVSDKYSGNHIRWSDDFAEETGYDPITTLAVTVRYRSGTYITKTEIILNADVGLQYNNRKLRQVILHEMGHTIGLGHTTEPGVMQANLNYAAEHLTVDDIDGANAVIEETLWRQANGYVSPNASEEGASCASVSVAGSEGGGPGSFLLSFGLGALAVILLRRKRRYLAVSVD